jgi:hypothetical protein
MKLPDSLGELPHEFRVGRVCICDELVDLLDERLRGLDVDVSWISAPQEIEQLPTQLFDIIGNDHTARAPVPIEHKLHLPKQIEAGAEAREAMFDFRHRRWELRVVELESTKLFLELTVLDGDRGANARVTLHGEVIDAACD